MHLGAVIDAFGVHVGEGLVHLGRLEGGADGEVVNQLFEANGRSSWLAGPRRTGEWSTAWRPGSRAAADQDWRASSSCSSSHPR
jgi:hypothetical protein